MFFKILVFFFSVQAIAFAIYFSTSSSCSLISLCF
ncbi:hypothetical protein X975_23340, partial [Stegodyphus mimosarum]